MAGMQATRRSLAPFFIMWTGQAVSLFGSYLVQFALIWWLTQETGSATVLATASIVGLVPQILLGSFSGTVVDRWNRRRIMMVTDSLVALATLVLAYLFGSGQAEIWHVYLILFVRAVTGSLQKPALMASTSMMVPGDSLARIQGLNQMLEGGLNIVSAPLGAFLLGIMPLQGVLAIDVVTAVVAVVSLTLVHVPQPNEDKAAGEIGESNESFWSDLRAGFRYVRGWPGLLILGLLATLVNLFLNPVFAMMPLLVTQHFQGGAVELGWLEAAAGVGIIMGGLLLGIWGGFKRRILTSMVSLVLLGGSVAWLGLTPASNFRMAVIAVWIIGVMLSMVNGPIHAVFQAVVAPEMQGRVLGLVSSMAMAASPVGMAVAGPMADVVGVRNWIIGAGFLVILVSSLGFFSPALMHLENNQKAEAPALTKVALASEELPEPLN